MDFKLPGLTTSPDPEPDQFLFTRSDQWSFVRQGIPSVDVRVGQKDGNGRTEDYAARKKAWLKTHRHTPKDEWEPGYDYESLAQVARVELLAGFAVASAAERPSWNKDDLLGRRFAKK